MFRRGRVRQSKEASVVGMIMGIVFIIIGVTTVIPNVGVFGAFWTLMAVVITASNGYNVFSKKGFTNYEVDVEMTNSNIINHNSFDEKLRKLKALKDDGLINDEEYEVKRREMLNEKW